MNTGGGGGWGAIRWLSSVWGVRTHPPPHDFLLWSGAGSGLTYDTMFPVSRSQIRSNLTSERLLWSILWRTNRCQLWHKPSLAYETHWLKTARPRGRAEAASAELNQRDQKGHLGSSTLSRNTSPSMNNPRIEPWQLYFKGLNQKILLIRDLLFFLFVYF